LRAAAAPDRVKVQGAGTPAKRFPAGKSPPGMPSFTRIFRFTYYSKRQGNDNMKQYFPLPSKIDTSTRWTQAEPKISLGSLSLGAYSQTIVRTGRKRAPLHEEALNGW